jgi:peptidoglycan hydrolase-like protein with peptidoglycan-binding domain
MPERERLLTVQRHAGNRAAARLLDSPGRPPELRRRSPDLPEGGDRAPGREENWIAATGALEAAVLARKASSGAAVGLLQRTVVAEGVPGSRPNTDLGDTGDGIKLLQRMLGADETGVFDPATRSAVDRFQRQQGWEPSGVGPDTWKALDNHAGAPGHRPNLIAGDRGPGVRLLQSMLGVKETSFFGPGTRAAVDHFQRQQGWDPTGVGPDTWTALDNHAGAPGHRPNLNPGDRGPGVRLLQASLGIPETAIFDPVTRKAVDDFQAAQGWPPSGVGPDTWKALEPEVSRLRVAQEMQKMADPAAPLWAKWHSSWQGKHPGPGMLASGYSTNFAEWASGPTETAFTVGPATVINCWEMVLYSAYHAGQLTWSWIHDRYVSVGGAWDVEMVKQLTPKGRTTFDRATQTPVPRRGDIVLFDGISHVALATGAGTHTYTFWPPPNVSVLFAGPRGHEYVVATPDKVKDYSIEDLAKACDNPLTGHVCVVQIGAPPWRP